MTIAGRIVFGIAVLFIAAIVWALAGYLATAPLGAIYGWSGHPAIPAAPKIVYILVYLLILPIVALLVAYWLLRSVRAIATRPNALFLALLFTANVASADPRLASAAAEQIGVTKLYDPSYVRLSYPGGDVPLDRGVCTDVVIRAFRKIGVDLQREVHEDMRRGFRAYPQMWGLRRPDRNIDHRRVPNLMTYFTRKGKHLARTDSYEPGDVVAWRLPNGLHHIGIVSDRKVPRSERYFMIHNIGAGAESEDILHSFQILGHYRW